MTGSGAVGLEGSPVMRGLGPSGVSPPQQPPLHRSLGLAPGRQGCPLGKEVRIRQGGEGTEAEEGTSLGPRSWRPARSGRVGGRGRDCCDWRRQLAGEVWGLSPGVVGAAPGPGESRDQAGCHRRAAGNKGLFFGA